MGLLLLAAACSSTSATTATKASREDRAATTAVVESPIVPPAEAPEGAPPATEGPAPSFAATEPVDGHGVWAVVVGISDYAGSSHDLLYARNDADDMVAALRQAGQPAAQRAVLTDGHATVAAIRSALAWLTANAGPDATAVVYFAGHVRKLAPETEALLTADSQVLPDAEVADRLTGLRASRTWIVIAGCYGGGFTEVLAPGRILTAAAPANSLAYETATYSRSYLGEYLVHRGMLQGRGGPTVQSAFAYAARELRRDHPGRVPVQFDQAGGPFSLTNGVSAATWSPPPAPTTTTTSPPRQASPATTTTTQTTTKGESSCLITAGSLVRCPDRRED
jgi:hypothetical protein